MKFYKSNTGKYYGADRLIDALEMAKADSPNIYVVVQEVRQNEIPRGTSITSKSERILRDRDEDEEAAELKRILRDRDHE